MERLALNSQRSARRSRSHDLPVLCLSRWKDRHRARRQFGARPAMLSLVLLHPFQFSAPAFRLQPSFPPSGPPPFSPLSLLLSACLLLLVLFFRRFFTFTTDERDLVADIYLAAFFDINFGERPIFG